MSRELEVRVARRYAEVVRCQYLIAEVYNKHYGIVFSKDCVDLHAKIEPYPHKYVMGLVDGEVVAAAGLYLRDTYVERYGQVTDDDLRAALGADAGRYDPSRKREYTKLVVKDGFEGSGLGRAFFAASHSRSFLEADASEPTLLVCCAKRSIFTALYDKVGIHTRNVKPFPYYKVHEKYRSETDPMESRLIAPAIDIPPEWYAHDLPRVVPLREATRPDPTRESPPRPEAG